MESDLVERLYRECYEELCRYAQQKLNRRDRAEELAQDAFVVAVRRRDELPELLNPVAWMYGVMRKLILRECIDRSVIAANTIPLAELSAKHEPYYTENMDLYDTYEDFAAYSDLPDNLSESDRKLLYDVYIDGYSLREVAAVLDITYEACRKRLERARKNARLPLFDEN
ncbi:MAG: sigma-70 family RNA polymerase sigma factor [Oscillospiraceae bacterium]|nr:sigma-70 family RNA polymerase sigma factor [Oscillospiraceae bacterium]